MSQQAVWKIGTDANVKGVIVHSSANVWNGGVGDNYTLNYIDYNNKVETLWFRNLQSLVASRPGVTLTVNTDTGYGDYTVKSVVQNGNVYKISVSFKSSSVSNITGDTLSLTYY
jgi:hypothetical protein